MVSTFVPVPFPVDLTGECMSWIKRACARYSSLSSLIKFELSPADKCKPWEDRVEECWSKPTACLWDNSSMVLQERSFRDSWVESRIAPTLMGYEILEERTKFTVYKILVTGSQGDRWVIFRRYTDFTKLNDKLRELFPSVCLTLPPKRWFKNNYDEEFLEARQTGLQTFLQNLTLDKDIINSEAVKHFLCLFDPPDPFDSLDESRAFCETLEETNHCLQRELVEKQREVDSLKEMIDPVSVRMCVLNTSTLSGDASVCYDYARLGPKCTRQRRNELSLSIFYSKY
uniref:Sorting nexin-16 n=1 Tax=Sphaeramia orbicularis TaxID=375764 RepID=A0A673AGM0_9TELE